MIREDGRKNNDLRKISFIPNFVKNADGSVLSICGDTQVVCTATIENEIPQWLEGKKQGWITAEYAMLPGSTHKRNRREKTGTGGRSSEIQRLIGRSLRAVTDLKKIPGVTINLDCDVINADGGTRCASLNGSFVALQLAIETILKKGQIIINPITCAIAAISVGIYRSEVMLDLCYNEDSKADVDMNIVMTAEDKYVEIQGNAEGSHSFSLEEKDQMLEMARIGIKKIIKMQDQIHIA